MIRHDGFICLRRLLHGFHDGCSRRHTIDVADPRSILGPSKPNGAESVLLKFKSVNSGFSIKY